MNRRWIQYVVGGLLLIAAVVGIWWGVNAGRKAAQSKQVLKDVTALQQAFEYFYNDQKRYPTTDEFIDQNLMRTYATNFPPQQFATDVCEQTFDYYNAFSREYILRFCLPVAAQGFSAGWNELTHKK